MNTLPRTGCYWLVSSCLCVVVTASLSPCHAKDALGEENATAWSFAITGVHDAALTQYDLRKNSSFIAKWIVSTELKNSTQSDLFVYSVPYYAGTVDGKLDLRRFLSGSKLPATDKGRDFFRIPPGGILKSKHEVYASRFKEKNGLYRISGLFIKHEGVPKDKEHNNFSREWDLYDTPVPASFELAMALFAYARDSDRAILNEDLANLWVGRKLTNPVKMKITLPSTHIDK